MNTTLLVVILALPTAPTMAALDARVEEFNRVVNVPIPAPFWPPIPVCVPR